MKKLLAATAVMFALIAADLPAKAEPTALFNWTGLYAGADAGALFSDARDRNPAAGVSAHPDSSALFYGGHLGYRYQFAKNWVAGIEGQLWGVKDDDARSPYSSGLPNDGLLTIKNGYTVLGTLGYVIHPQLLAYGAAGWSGLHYTGCTTIGNGGLCAPASGFSADPSAFTWGGGIAILANQSFILRFQYLHADYGSKNFTTPGVFGALTAAELKTDTFTAGISWKFGS